MDSNPSPRPLRIMGPHHAAKRFSALPRAGQPPIHGVENECKTSNHQGGPATHARRSLPGLHRGEWHGPVPVRSLKESNSSMTRSSRDPRSSKTGNREILDDWNPSISGDDVDAEPHQARSGLHSAAQSSSTSAADSTSTGPPHFAWADLDRADPAAPRPLSSREARRAPAASCWMASSSRSRSRFGAVPSLLAPTTHHRGTCLNQVRCSRAFASSLSWAAARSRGSSSPRISASVAGPWPSRCRVPTETSPRYFAAPAYPHRAGALGVRRSGKRSARAVHALFRWGEPRPGARGVRRSHPDAPRWSQPRQGPRPGQPGLYFTIEPGAGVSASGRRQRAWRPDQAASPGPPLYPLVARNESQAASRFRSLLTRWVGPRR